ncbi:hypothetical protein C2845_PM13G24710 [Panicum miliaceum]|uniref:Uncharacterized protein n=1 Tax=Panicum miliaceum TaxID=4540 RepID=A0A3L6RMU1_PANMI|nr:hypothetical protein C2845_PM13G24710 [Panicum miliaceum]
MVKDGFSYEATLPDGSVVSLLVDQFIVVEKGEFATFYIHRNAVNYNVKMINAVEFGDQEEVSRFTSVRVADFDKRQNIFFPGARVIDKEDQDSFFMLDWFSKNVGAPVFNEAKALVGICYHSPLEPSFAYTLSRIKDNLLKLSEVPGQTFEEFLPTL